MTAVGHSSVNLKLSAVLPEVVKSPAAVLNCVSAVFLIFVSMTVLDTSDLLAPVSIKAFSWAFFFGLFLVLVLPACSIRAYRIGTKSFSFSSF